MEGRVVWKDTYQKWLQRIIQLQVLQKKKKVLLEFSRKHTFSPIVEVADKEWSVLQSQLEEAFSTKIQNSPSRIGRK
ncbi:hypothetical protein CleRT_06830 [Candidatus Coxiella mudrowiae]|uniref:Uncharacterized protein n=1 Tax=Candidatus Coxiella mudrowiae TaxID=2054173 RepID=A0ABN4HRG7_9COXI|nr:hypothetical protein CleRT_05390 [Candidatus Coxiella mudrowiae]AKQ33531.1 hypothetical protein CleRT_06830 [Candidatus Coxiella mudrowiae]